VSPDNKTGFISSNRDGGKGSDDIYILGQVPPCDVDVAFTVEDEAGVAIPQALVEVVNNTEDTTDSDTATTTGKYLFSSKCNRDYTVTASADGYKSKTRTLTVGKSGVTNVITLEAIEPPVITKTEVVLNPIYFDFDKWNIRPDAAAELDRLVFAMQNNPTMVISGESHTDSRGSNSYNQTLSQKRAESMRDYVLSKGISPSRISGVGKGESQPSVNCGANCTEDEHQLNRRGVFRIISR
jgi:outer membrane protein OmpA-like peptidoglycan-associated protein